MKYLKTFPLILLLIGFLFAEFDRSSVLIDIPTAQILAEKTFAFNYNGSFGLERIPSYSSDKYYEDGANFRIGVANQLEFSITAYTRRNYVLGFTHLLIKPERAQDFAFAWGIHDIGINKDISSKGDGLNSAWFDDFSYQKTAGLKPAENFSLFGVATKSITDFFRVHIGIGRGRYVGYGDRSQYLNTDVFFNTKHQWAFGLFGGLELHIQDFLRLGLEADGRDINLGVRGNIGPIQIATALSKMEALLWGGNYERLALGIAFNHSLFSKPQPKMPTPSPIPKPIFGAILGKVFDADTKTPLSVKILVGNPQLPPILSNSNGEFEIKEIEPGEIKIAFEKEGYETEHRILTIAAGTTERVEVELKKKKIGEEKKIVSPPSLEIVYFNFDDATLLPNMMPIMARNAQILKENPELKVMIEGHTCEIGTDEYNFQLGKRRAETVYHYLISQGITQERLRMISYGRTRPRVNGLLAQNRRVEFRLE